MPGTKNVRRNVFAGRGDTGTLRNTDGHTPGRVPTHKHTSPARIFSIVSRRVTITLRGNTFTTFTFHGHDVRALLTHPVVRGRQCKQTTFSAAAGSRRFHAQHRTTTGILGAQYILTRIRGYTRRVWRTRDYYLERHY